MDGYSPVIQMMPDGREFLGVAESWLNQDEVRNNTILSIATQAGRPYSMLRAPFWFGVATGYERVCGVAVHAEPDGLVLSRMERDACRQIVRELIDAGITPKRVYGPVEIVGWAAAEIEARSGCQLRRTRQWQAFATARPVGSIAKPYGYLRAATAEDTGVVQQFGQQYAKEKPSLVDAADYFLSKLAAGDLRLWIGGDGDSIKSLVAISGRTKSVVRIAGVFTPRRHRSFGFASAAIAEVVDIELDAGADQVCLMVDRSEKHLISTYEKLGFSPVEDCVEYVDAELARERAIKFNK